MSPNKIQSEKAYLDRTVNHWHRTAMPANAFAADLDLYGYCPKKKCQHPIYYIEASKDGCHDMFRTIMHARQFGCAAFLIRHNGRKVICGERFWPEPRLVIVGGEVGLAIELNRLIGLHRCQG